MERSVVVHGHVYACLCSSLLTSGLKEISESAVFRSLQDDAQAQPEVRWTEHAGCCLEIKCTRW